MTQDRLQNLMLLYEEQDLVASANVDTVIDEFKTVVPFERRFVFLKNTSYIFLMLLNSLWLFEGLQAGGD
jgi:hypothetical protein